MRKLVYLAFIFCAIVSCKNSEKNTASEPLAIETEAESSDYENYGEKISEERAMDAKAMAQNYKQLKPGDTIFVSFVSTVKAVCKKKGCWMDLKMPDEAEVNVKFKDYGFFVPKDIEGKEVVVKGKAFIEEVSIEDQKHYAKDAGKPEAEIEKIQTPKHSYAFMADGVLLKK